MKIAVVNDVHVGRHLEYNGKVRASSHLVEDRLPGFLQDIIRHHAPDVLINLGDLIRSEEREADLIRYRRLIANFQQIQTPVIHLLGNHELKKMPLADIENIWQQSGFDQKSYGCKTIDNFTFLWIGLDFKDHRIFTLPHEQLNWLKKQLARIDRPALIFTHCAIDDHDVNGNFFFETYDNIKKTALFLENQAEIRDTIFESGKVIAVIQAHLHYFHSKTINGIPYVTCPAMGDNICGPHVNDNVPEIYTLLTFEQNHFTAKAFSGKYCFAGYESVFNNLGERNRN